jgi:leader peptidase (prepilin peptidase)/N-methyltransferase
MDFLYFFVFLFGLLVGSFLNFLIYEIERVEIKKEKPFFRTRSICPKCGHILGFFDLIPVLSFLLLRGRCRYCSEKISWQYPLVELSTAFLFFALFFVFLNNPQYLELSPSFYLSFLYYLLIICFFIIFFVVDLKHFIIPDTIFFTALFTSILYKIVIYLNYGFSLRELFLSFIPAFLFFLFVFFSKGTLMGLGDVKLMFLMGLILGWQKTLLSLFFAFLLGAIIGIGLIVAKKKSLKSEIPFGPFLATGTFIAIFLGDIIVNLYKSLFIVF